MKKIFAKIKELWQKVNGIKDFLKDIILIYVAIVFLFALFILGIAKYFGYSIFNS